MTSQKNQMKEGDGGSDRGRDFDGETSGKVH